MPSGVRGYRWVLTGVRVWELEDGRPGSRHFLGCVSGYGPSDFRWHVASPFGGFSGEAAGRRAAMNEVEKHVIADRLYAATKRLGGLK